MIESTLRIAATLISFNFETYLNRAGRNMSIRWIAQQVVLGESASDSTQNTAFPEGETL
jgi:hypothetical protein